MALPVVAASHGSGLVWLLAVTLAAVILGIVVAGPWLTMGVGQLLVRLARRPSTLLAGHRLATDPAAGFRSIGGLVLAVFLVTVTAVATASARTPAAEPGQTFVPTGAVGLEFLYRGAQPLPDAQATSLVTRLHAVPGVRAVLDLRWAGSGPPTPDATHLPVLTSCADLRATGLADCPDPATVVGLDARALGNGFAQDIGRPTPGTFPGRGPMLAVVATTDNRPDTIEAVRTVMETVAADATWLPWPTDEVKAHSNEQATQVSRISIAALLATLLIAGLSLAVATAGGLLERRRPFTLLRLADSSAGQIRRVLVTETAAPLLTATLVSAGIGLAVAADMSHAAHQPWHSPPAGYWILLAAGTTTALAAALLTTMPLLSRLTAPDTARFE